METIINFFTTDQTTRHQFFINIWKMLLALLIANLKMNEQHHFFNNLEVKLNTIISFVLSKDFLLGFSYYILFVFVFFWLIKVVLYFVFTFLINGTKQWNREMILNFLRIYLIKDISSPTGYKLRNQLSKEIIESLLEDKKDVYNILNNLESIISLTFSTAYTYFMLGFPLEKEFSFLGYLLWTIFAISLIICLSVMFSLTKTEKLKQVFEEIINSKV